MTIQRYAFGNGPHGPQMEESKTGEWVLYRDLEAEIAELKPKGWFDETCDNEECGAKFETNSPIENRPCPQCGRGVLRRAQ